MKIENGKTNKSRCLTAFLSSALIVVFLAGSFAANRFFTHESQQSTRISSLEKQIIFLEDKIDALGDNPDEIFPENAGGG